MKLNNKLAVVTGSSKGIGLALCELLLEKSMVVVGLSRTPTQIQHPSFIHLFCDVGDENQVNHAFNEIKKQINLPIQVLINNAGIGIFSKFEETPAEEWRKIYDVNVHSILYCSKAVIPDMKFCKEGHIINISSIAGKSGIENFSAYCGTKFAVRGISEAMFKELREYGIKVSCILPGSVNTNFFDNLSGFVKNTDILEAKEVAKVILSLLETEPNFLPTELEIRPLRPKKRG